MESPPLTQWSYWRKRHWLWGISTSQLGCNISVIVPLGLATYLLHRECFIHIDADALKYNRRRRVKYPCILYPFISALCRPKVFIIRVNVFLYNSMTSSTCIETWLQQRWEIEMNTRPNLTRRSITDHLVRLWSTTELCWKGQMPRHCASSLSCAHSTLYFQCEASSHWKDNTYDVEHFWPQYSSIWELSIFDSFYDWWQSENDGLNESCEYSNFEIIRSRTRLIPFLATGLR